MKNLKRNKIIIKKIIKENKDRDTNYKENNNENEQTNGLKNNINPFQF